MSKRATQNYVSFRRKSATVLLVSALGLSLGACAGDDVGSMSASRAGTPAQPVVIRSDLPPAAAHTGADGYPNINVDTAVPVRAPVRTAEERGRIEAELMALGERQRGSAGESPQSVVQELQELGRRSKAEALRRIESGETTDRP